MLDVPVARSRYSDLERTPRSLNAIPLPYICVALTFKPCLSCVAADRAAAAPEEEVAEILLEGGRRTWTGGAVGVGAKMASRTRSFSSTRASISLEFDRDWAGRGDGGVGLTEFVGGDVSAGGEGSTRRRTRSS